MRLVGLTGGVGSGKSTVAEMLRSLGATLIDADEAARAVVEPGTPGFDQVVAAFGPEFVSHGRLDRQRLAALVFKDPEARRRLNSIVHPLVGEWMAARREEAEAAGAEVAVLDVPLLYENGLEGAFEAVIVVYADPETQVRRLVDGRGFSEADARARIAAQLPIATKRVRASHVVDNNGSVDRTRQQVEEVWAGLSGS